jgi:hypothetical protein
MLSWIDTVRTALDAVNWDISVMAICSMRTRVLLHGRSSGVFITLTALMRQRRPFASGRHVEGVCKGQRCSEGWTGIIDKGMNFNEMMS